MKKLLFAFLFAQACAVNAQQLFSSMVEQNNKQLSGYVFVSLAMPDSHLIGIARDAYRSGMTIVLNGYMDGYPRNKDETQKRVLEINRACCGERGGAHWMINPPLYDRYKISNVPAFVIAKGASSSPMDYSKVSGEMSIPIALRFFYQNSQIPEVKTKSHEIYQRFANNQ